MEDDKQSDCCNDADTNTLVELLSTRGDREFGHLLLGVCLLEVRSGREVKTRTVLFAFSVLSRKSSWRFRSFITTYVATVEVARKTALH